MAKEKKQCEQCENEVDEQFSKTLCFSCYHQEYLEDRKKNPDKYCSITWENPYELKR
jgi:hypothetical protein